MTGRASPVPRDVAVAGLAAGCPVVPEAAPSRNTSKSFRNHSIFTADKTQSQPYISNFTKIYFKCKLAHT